MTVKQKMIDKFGSINAYCVASGENYSTVYYQLNNLEEDHVNVKRLGRKVKYTKPKNVISKEERQIIDNSITAAFGSKVNLCRKTDFSISFINDLVNGRRKFKTDKYKDLVNILRSNIIGSTSYELYLKSKL